MPRPPLSGTLCTAAFREARYRRCNVWDLSCERAAGWPEGTAARWSVVPAAHMPQQSAALQRSPAESGPSNRWSCPGTRDGSWSNQPLVSWAKVQAGGLHRGLVTVGWKPGCVCSRLGRGAGDGRGRRPRRVSARAASPHCCSIGSSAELRLCRKVSGSGPSLSCRQAASSPQTTAATRVEFAMGRSMHGSGLPGPAPLWPKAQTTNRLLCSDGCGYGN